MNNLDIIDKQIFALAEMSQSEIEEKEIESILDNLEMEREGE